MIKLRPMEKEQLIKLIDKYLAGECDQAEARQIENWYDSLKNGEKDFYNGEIEHINVSARRSLAKIRNKLNLINDDGSILSLTRKTLVWRWAVAASIAVMVAIGTSMYLDRDTKTSFVVVNAPTGKIRKVHLPDGTLVWLNAGTQLKYSLEYNTNDRDVWISGEAFFDVKHDAEKPFNVVAGNVKTHVLGTAFSVSAYPNTLMKTVTVLRGKVQVINQQKLLGYLLPDQKLEYNSLKNTSKIVSVSANRVTSWKSGKLAFIDMPMQDIAVHLQKWYGVSFVFKNQQLKNTRFTASFNSSISLEELLLMMSEVSHVKYLLDDKTKTITYL